MPNFISEAQIEAALVGLLVKQYGFQSLDCFTQEAGALPDKSGRASKREVVLRERLRDAVRRLNPTVPLPVLESALEVLLEARVSLSPVAANAEIYGLLRDGYAVEFEGEDGHKRRERVRFIAWNDAGSNEFLAVTQLWIQGETGFRRPDVLIYVNGLPLVFIELKNSNVKVQSAYDDNFTNYKRDIPQLFACNAFCVLSNAIETRVGSMSAQWEHFFKWLRADDEREVVDRIGIEERGESMERVIAGLFAPARLLDYIENFVLYSKGQHKIIAQNHQFIGVNRALDSFERRGELDGKLGVFWHTQGSGKSFSMIFYVRKIQRKHAGNWTFVVVTDRTDLDGQIYRNFLHTGVITPQDKALPANSEELRTFLAGNKPLIFSLIQKFRYDKGKRYPVLTERNDVVVIVDEAHRTQYKDLAENLRAGLPNAGFLAFTGTPLLGAERKTNRWFGDYVSEYNFAQSIDDGATVPLFYQKRVPSVLIQNEALSADFADICEDENLDEAQREKLENRFAREVEVIKRDDRLETIARDIVYHLPRRGYKGKAMVVSLDKFTAVRMFDKVARLWKDAKKELQGDISKTSDAGEKVLLQERLKYMQSLEMAVVVSEEAGEEPKFAEQGLSLKPHRDRMNRIDAHGADVEDNFKDPAHPLQLVFVCAMWLTGFDAPTLSTLYLDKPMRDHTLMQTIARANRVSGWKIGGVEKKNGEIVDYYNVFRNMKDALRAYAGGRDGEELPVREKDELFVLLDEALAQATVFCAGVGVDIPALLHREDVFKNVEAFKTGADTLLSKDEWRKGFAVYENTISGLYEAAKPEIMGRPVRRSVAVFAYLRGVLEAIIERTDISAVALRVSELLDESIVAGEAKEDEGGQSENAPGGSGSMKVGKVWNLSDIPFDELQSEFKDAPHPHIAIADLRAFLESKLAAMMGQNATRADFALRLQSIIDLYNTGTASADNAFEELVEFARELQLESERHIREGLTEDELELFDLLQKDALSEAETGKVRLAAQSLLHRLREESPKVLVQDWFKDTSSKSRVFLTVQEVLHSHLPDSYDRPMFAQKCQTIFDSLLLRAANGQKWST